MNEDPDLQARGEGGEVEGAEDGTGAVQPLYVEEATGGSRGVGSADRKIPPIVSHWNLAEYLPASVRQVFLVRVEVPSFSIWSRCQRDRGLSFRLWICSRTFTSGFDEQLASLE